VGDPQRGQELAEHGAVVHVAGGQQDHQQSGGPIGQRGHLGGQPAPGPADRVVGGSLIASSGA
jgi:hypothetical protein